LAILRLQIAQTVNVESISQMDILKTRSHDQIGNGNAFLFLNSY
jgi:hypothetical protein